MTQIILHTSDEISICDSGNIYDMVQKFRKDLEKEVFKFNPYNICVANIQVNGKQHTVIFHVDDLMSIHMENKVNYNFDYWLTKCMVDM